MVAEMFGVEVDNKEDSTLKSSVLNALQKGDHVFYLEFGEHSIYWCHLRDARPKRSWDSGFVGVVIVRREAWFKAMPRSTFARSYVSKVLYESWDDQMNAYLNGWFYEANIEDPDDNLNYWMSGFLSPEVALQEAMAEYPDICHEEDEFDDCGNFIFEVA